MHFVIFHTFHSLKSTFLPLDSGHFITGADTLIRVLAKNRGYGRLLAAPTGRMRSSGYFLKSGVSGGFYPPLQSVCEPVSGQYRIGRVREAMYWYKPCALLSGGTAARADSIRPYGCGGNHAPTATNGVHLLSNF